MTRWELAFLLEKIKFLEKDLLERQTLKSFPHPLNQDLHSQIFVCTLRQEALPWEVPILLATSNPQLFFGISSWHHRTICRTGEKETTKGLEKMWFCPHSLLGQFSRNRWFKGWWTCRKWRTSKGKADTAGMSYENPDPKLASPRQYHVSKPAGGTMGLSRMLQKPQFRGEGR